MSKLLTVFGASGNQGGSVVRAVLKDPVLSKEFQIRAITRDSFKAPIVQFAEKGVEIVNADMSSTESIARAVKDVHTVFLMTNFWESMSANTEVAQGKAVVDASKAAGVQHLIFSSLINTTEASKGRLPDIAHFDGKAKIEDYIRGSGVRATFVLPGLFMSGYFDTIRKNEDGSYMLALPVSEEKAQIPLFDAAGDMGKYVRAALKDYPSCVGKHIYAAVDYYTPKRLVAEFGEVLGVPAAFAQIPEEMFKSFLPPPVAQELLENMLLLEDPGYYAGAKLGESLRFMDGEPTTWKEFVQANKARWV
ncbi:hypothetical protein LTR37_002179 [Vermiconidia calcicola]|uniref:Uncharacterized protein n=1 Tax=Vermiconidia calcicola TaxID=1690605 RepID=A0ACC3NUB1_9PEZI|nr:hypothetical protein LTR37_002179 [Vermiconidia calcicola]